MSLPSVQLGCGGSGGHGSAPGGALNTTLRAGSPWWSSGGSTRDKRAPPAGRPTHKLAGAVPRNGCYDRFPRRLRGVQWPSRYWCTYQRCCGNAGPMVLTRRAPPAGDRPEERRAPTQRLEGTNPRTGRRYLLTLSVTTCSSWTSAIACSR